MERGRRKGGGGRYCKSGNEGRSNQMSQGKPPSATGARTKHVTYTFGKNRIKSMINRSLNPALKCLHTTSKIASLSGQMQSRRRLACELTNGYLPQQPFPEELQLRQVQYSRMSLAQLHKLLQLRYLRRINSPQFGRHCSSKFAKVKHVRACAVVTELMFMYICIGRVTN